MSVDGSLWYVKLADGDVERVTLDQLDQAFQSGEIDEDSMVLAAGSDKWEKLSDLLGATEPAPVPAAAPVPAPAPAAAVSPRVAVPSPAPVTAVAHPVNGAAHAASGARLPSSLPNGAVSSVRPVSLDLGVIGDDPAFRKSSKKRWAVGLLAAVAVAGVGAFFAMKQTAASAASDPTPAFATAAAAVAAASPPPAPIDPPSSAPPSAPAQPAATATGVAQGGVSSVMDPTKRLSDDTRQKLLEADKKGKKPKAHASGGGGGGGGHAPSKEKSSAFTTSGNKYDPLNSSL